MTEFKIGVDSTRNNEKPVKKYEISQISERIGGSRYTVNQSNLKSFVKLLSGDGITFCPATFKKAKSAKELSEAFYSTTGLKRENNIEQTQLMVLDFDNDKPDKMISWQQAKARADENNLLSYLLMKHYLLLKTKKNSE